MAVKQETKTKTKPKTTSKAKPKTTAKAKPQKDPTLASFTPEAKLIIHNPDNDSRLAFGPGVASICYGIQKHGTLADAAKEMDISYSKAWKIVGECEEAMGVQLIIRKKPQGCWLTPVGEELLAGYMKIQAKISAETEKLFDKIFR